MDGLVSEWMVHGLIDGWVVGWRDRGWMDRWRGAVRDIEEERIDGFSEQKHRSSSLTKKFCQKVKKWWPF